MIKNIYKSWKLICKSSHFSLAYFSPAKFSSLARKTYHNARKVIKMFSRDFDPVATR